MRYFDTSFLVPLILLEATSEPITAFFGSLPDEDLAVSHWTRVEFASLLAREVRMGALDAAVARRAGSRFETMIRQSFAVRAHARLLAFFAGATAKATWYFSSNALIFRLGRHGRRQGAVVVSCSEAQTRRNA